MKTTLSLQSAINIGGCQNGIQRYIDFIEASGYTIDTEFDFDFFVSLCKEKNARFLESFVIENKARILEYTDSQIQNYIFRGVNFNTLEEARTEAQQYKQERYEYHKALTTVGFDQNINGNSVWTCIDIDVFKISDSLTGYALYVFNHTTGQYESVGSIEEAKQKRDDLINSFMDLETANLVIYKKLLFAEDGVSTTIEVAERI